MCVVGHVCAPGLCVVSTGEQARTTNYLILLNSTMYHDMPYRIVHA